MMKTCSNMAAVNSIGERRAEKTQRPDLRVHVLGGGAGDGQGFFQGRLVLVEADHGVVVTAPALVHQTAKLAAFVRLPGLILFQKRGELLNDFKKGTDFLALLHGPDNHQVQLVSKTMDVRDILLQHAGYVGLHTLLLP